MSKSDNALVERTGVLAVASTFINDFKWFFREQRELDWGIDAQVEQVEGGKPTGKLFALQIKTGESYFKPHGKDFIYYGELKHLDYWADHSLPVYLILHNPESGLTLWQRVVRHACVAHEKGWSMVVPACNILDGKAKHFFEAGIASNEEGSRRLRFLLDRELMGKIADQEVYFIWEDWVNKSLGLRNLQIFIGHNPSYAFGEKREPDVAYDTWYLPTHDVALAMSVFFPWVEYEYAEEIQEDSECEEHVLEGHLTAAAKGYLEAERFFRDGPDWEAPEPVYETSEEDDFRAAEEEDWLREEEENLRRETDAKGEGSR